MWILYLLSHSLLSGSLLLPIMVLLRWAAERRGLRWLTLSKERWILSWASLGLLQIVAMAALLPKFLRNDFLGWSGAAVWNLLYVVLIRAQSNSLAYWLVASVTAILEGAMYGAFAATAWWLFRWATQAPIERERKVSDKYRVALLLSGCLWGIANNVYSLRPVTCFDCFSPQGIPFTFFHEGGFAGGQGFVWNGVIGDALLILLFGAILGRVWNWFSRKHSGVNRIAV
jgi:hypothetical protein